MKAMKPMTSSVRLGGSVQQHSNCRAPWLMTAVFLLGVAGCGVSEEGTSFENEALATQEQESATGEDMDTLGLTTNGLTTNGLTTNGLTTNGLTTNGLTTNGLTTTTFSNWFEADPNVRKMVMKYIVLCAVPQGQTRTYVSSLTGRTYTWTGLLGLAPNWAAGSQPTLDEQQVITACLAAHANKYGVHIYISLLGRSATGTEIPYTSGELATYSEKEACFFGNTFNDQGFFAANDRNFLLSSESSPRACGLSANNQSTDCPPLTHVGKCKDYCTLDSTKTYYVSCTYNGVTYKPMTTRIKPADVYSCGDGTCQFTEKCGTGSTYNNCNSDCGACPP